MTRRFGARHSISCRRSLALGQCFMGWVSPNAKTAMLDALAPFPTRYSLTARARARESLTLCNCEAIGSVCPERMMESICASPEKRATTSRSSLAIASSVSSAFRNSKRIVTPNLTASGPAAAMAAGFATATSGGSARRGALGTAIGVGAGREASGFDSRAGERGGAISAGGAFRVSGAAHPANAASTRMTGLTLSDGATATLGKRSLHLSWSLGRPSAPRASSRPRLPRHPNLCGLQAERRPAPRR